MTGTKRNMRALVAIGVIAVLIVGCTTIQRSLSFIPGIPDPTKTAIRSINIRAAENANDTSSTQVDVLFLLDSSLTEILPATAPEWFENRSFLISNHRHQMLVASKGIALSADEQITMPRGYRDAEDVIVYADYVLASGQKWYRVPNVKDVRILLTRTVIELDPTPN